LRLSISDGQGLRASDQFGRQPAYRARHGLSSRAKATRGSEDVRMMRLLVLGWNVGTCFSAHGRRGFCASKRRMTRVAKARATRSAAIAAAMSCAALRCAGCRYRRFPSSPTSTARHSANARTAPSTRRDFCISCRLRGNSCGLYMSVILPRLICRTESS